jgi:hypothetical protein
MRKRLSESYRFTVKRQCWFPMRVDPDFQRKMTWRAPKSYGRRAARKVVETIAQYVHDEGLCDTLVDVDDLLALATREL